MTSASTKTGMKMSLRRTISNWSTSTYPLVGLFYFLEDNIKELTFTPTATYNELVYDWIDEVVHALPAESPKRRELKDNMHILRRFITAQVYAGLLFRDTEQLMDVSVETLKEVLFYFSAVFAMKDLQLPIKEKLNDQLEKETELFNEIVLSRLNRTRQAKLADHIATDTTYPSEMKTMLTAAKKPTVPKLNGKGKAAAKKAPPASTPAPAPVVAAPPPAEPRTLTVFQRNQARIQQAQAAKEASTPGPSPLQSIAEAVVEQKQKEQDAKARVHLPLPRNILPTIPTPRVAIKPEPRTFCEGNNLWEEDEKGDTRLVQENSPACYTPQIVEADPCVFTSPSLDKVAQELVRDSMKDARQPHEILKDTILKEMTTLSEQTEKVKSLVAQYTQDPAVYKDSWNDLEVEALLIDPNVAAVLKPYHQEMYAREKPQTTIKDEMILEVFQDIGAAVKNINDKFDKLKGLMGK